MNYQMYDAKKFFWKRSKYQGKMWYIQNDSAYRAIWEKTKELTSVRASHTWDQGKYFDTFW